MQFKIIAAFLALVSLAGVVGAGYIIVDRVGVLASSEMHAGVVVSCKSKITKRASRRSGRARQRWSYTPVAITKSGQKSFGTLFFPKRSTCEQLIGKTVSVFVNKADAAKNRINSFTQFWLFPSVILFVLAFVVGVLTKPALAVLAFISFFSLSTLAVALELNWFGGRAATTEVSAQDRSQLALDQCTRAHMDKEKVHRKSDLKKLNCRNLGLVDITSLSDFTGLEELYLQSNELTSLAPLHSLKKLRKLSIMLNKRLMSLKGIEELTALEELRAHSMRVNSVEPLRGLKSLRLLSMSRNNVADISALRELNELEYVEMNYNPVSDISALANKPNLTRVNFFGSNVADLSPLNGNKSLEIVGVSGKAFRNCAQLDALQQQLSPAAKVYRPKICR